LTDRPSYEGGSNFDQLGAFGDAEGSRARIDDVMRDFVAFDSVPTYGGLSFDTQDILRSRIIVGGKGTGKSVYLRRLQAMASEQAVRGAIYSDQDSLYADHIQQDVPTTESIVRVSDWYENHFLTEKWEWIWRRAVMRSLVAHLLTVPRLRAHLDESIVDDLLEYSPNLYRKFRKPVSIYSQVREVLNKHTTQGGLNKYIDHYDWDDLEATLGEALRLCPPICFYVDAIDDEFAHAPAYWLMCQKGLFYAVMRLLRDHAFGGKLHVMICVRDVVFSSILRSEHADRYRDSRHIRMLSWDYGSLRFFLRAKLEQISDSYFLNPRPDDTEQSVAAWLGCDKVRNTNREKPHDEKIDDYLIRHIRPQPRDIVILGNKLCRAISEAREKDSTQTSQQWIKDIVAQAAKQFGDLQLTVCANQISADMMYPYAAEHGAVNVTAYAPSVNQQLKTFLHKDVGRDRFDNAYCKEIADLANREFAGQTDLLSVLWQNGLLGYGEGDTKHGNVTFYRLDDRAEDLILPPDKDFYALHSCLIDSAGVTSVGDPVFPYERGQGR
jgi:hypothetical protein